MSLVQRNLRLACLPLRRRCLKRQASWLSMQSLAAPPARDAVRLLPKVPSALVPLLMTPAVMTAPNGTYHVACFPASSYPVFPVENLKGFDSIKLQELEENYKRDGNAANQSSEPNLQEEMVDNMLVSKGAENNLEEVKLSAGNNRIHPVISFLVSDTNKDYKGATLPTHWKAFKTVIFHEQEDGLRASPKIAAFDFDGCLAKTSVRIIGADKWSLQHKSIPEKLQRLYIDGYKLVIFTNESNIDCWKNKRQEAVDSKVGRLDNFIDCVKVPIQVFIACGVGKGKGTPDDPYRKPNPGMWWLMAQHFNSGIEIDRINLSMLATLLGERTIIAMPI